MDTRRTVSTLVAATLLGGSPAYAQEAPSSDPAEGSPSGLQYELPVDGARKDASPSDTPRDKRTTGDGEAGTESPLRSENGLGTSSEVPGAGASAAGEDDDDAKGSGKGSGAGEGSGEGSGSGSGSGSGEESGAGGGDTPSADPVAAAEADGVQAGLLLGLSALVGGGVGIVARRSRRRD